MVTSATPVIPAPLQEQLAEGGRMVVPVGSRHVQQLKRVVRWNERVAVEELEPCRFVPLIGAHGWSERELEEEG